jgi:hypothetical protein
MVNGCPRSSGDLPKRHMLVILISSGAKNLRRPTWFGVFSEMVGFPRTIAEIVQNTILTA